MSGAAKGAAGGPPKDAAAEAARRYQDELKTLSREEKIHLAGFVCHHAWADRSIHAGERTFMRRLVTEMGLLGPDAAKVEGWLATPPPLDHARLDAVPLERRKIFAQAAEKVLYADGRIDHAEFGALERLKQALLGEAATPKRR